MSEDRNVERHMKTDRRSSQCIMRYIPRQGITKTTCMETMSATEFEYKHEKGIVADSGGEIRRQFAIISIEP